MTPELQNAELVGNVHPGFHDAQLIARILAGERELFHELVRPHQRTVYYKTLPILRSEQEAEDAAQETMLKALKNLHTFRAESKFSTWLISIAVNEARARLRHGRILRLESVDHPVKDDHGNFTAAMITDPREVPLQALERKELHQMLQQAIASLPRIYREVLQLRDVEELSIAETAALLGVSQGAVKTRLLRARLRMQKILHHSCRTPDAPVGSTSGSISELRLSPDRVGKRCSKRLRAHLRRKGFSKYV
ncbi:MAG: sigma-70 family RNA polymerase sigma factor [Terriglobales bacterium]